MREDYEDIIEEDNDEELNEAPLEGEGSDGRFDKLLESDSKKYKLSGMFKEWYLDYASYVILHRAVPHIVDGLKPVQRRVLHAMFKVDNGSYTKVATLVGEAMKYHPHGDASILGAMVQIGQKGFAIDCQGNWGNILTGDANAAPRYIEARLSKFAKEVVFDPRITNWMNSYDGRNQEPTELPVRFPLLLAQGTEGIGVGMSSRILPHNFNELIDASICILKNEPYEIYPDFPTGGYADCSKYMQGRRGGSVRIRAKVEKVDKNTISITDIPYGKTTKILTDSILKAKDKGKIKLKNIEDLTTDKVKIIIHLPSDVSPDKTIDALYAFTDCETTITPNACVIVDNKPAFLSVHDILEYSTQHTKDLLLAQLQFRLNELENNWHYTSLERIFFENKVYKILEEDFESWDAQKEAILNRMKEYERSLRREISMEDIDKLVDKPVRKLSKFDTKVLDEKLLAIESEISEVHHDIDHIVEFTIDWFTHLKQTYGDKFPRLTEITGFETITAQKVINNNAKLYANLEKGFVGMSLKKDDNGTYICDCSDLSEVIVIRKDGKFKVSKITDKAYFGENLLYVGLFNRGDNRTIYNVIYRMGKTSIYYAKRFAITSITRDKEYDITTGDEGSQVVWLSVNHNGEAETVKIQLKPKAKIKKMVFEYDFSTLAIKGRSSRGNLVSKNVIHKISLKSAGVSTIAGKDIWYDADIQKLNDEQRGLYLGAFGTDDKVLAIFKNGTFYTTSFDVSNRYPGDLLKIEKFDPNKTYTALYYDGASKTYYVKRFSFILSDNTPMSFISEHPKSRLVALSEDTRPQYLVIFGGKSEHREPEAVDASAWIAKKGISAKGKKCHDREIKEVKFIEPLEEEENAALDSEEKDNSPIVNSILNEEADTPLDSFDENIEEPTLF